MISGNTIICFANGWDYHPTSKHHVMRKLSEANQIIWVNWHASRRPRIFSRDLREVLAKLGQIRRGARPVSSSMTVLTPPQVPLPGSRLARRGNQLLVRRAIQKVLRRLPPRPVQVWSFAPDIADLVGSFGEELVLYYCVDAFAEFPGYDHDLILQRERELMARSDIVIATSPPLYEHCRQLHPDVHLVQHGVDHAHLSRAVHEGFEMPPELRKLPRPIFGFVGTIGGWVDLDMLAELARRRPQASIVIIGPEEWRRGACGALRNVHWLGPRNHAQLPSYLKFFDVGLIPFRQTPLTHAANPIKLFEYLAAGVPVVSTPMPVVEAIPGAVWVTTSPAEMAEACDAAVAGNTPAERQRRSKLMLAESWNARLEQISAIVSGRSARSDKPAPIRHTPCVREAEMASCA